MDDEERNRKIEAFLGLLHNDGQQYRSGDGGEYNCRIVVPAFHSPQLEVFSGEDPVECDFVPRKEVYGLEEDGEDEVVEGLDCDNLCKDEFGVEP